jgi:RNA polymerase sigma factor (sigma-70 family)
MPHSELVNQLLENRDAVLSFVYVLTRDFADAEEIFQEVAKVILEEAGKGVTVAQFMPWAREIARRRIGEFYRKNAKRNMVEKPTESIEAVIGQAFAENEKMLESSHLRLKALLDCLATLSGRTQAVIEGFYRNRQSIRDIAGSLGWNEQSVKNCLWRARKALADCIRGKLRTALEIP